MSGKRVKNTCIYYERESQIRTSRLIETLRFLLCISVSNKPFACAVFGIHRVKVLFCDNDFWLFVNSWGKEKPIERKKQVVKNETERSEVEFSLPAFARWVIEICTEYENGSV